MAYKLKKNHILRLIDNVFIPFDEGNYDYREYLEWVAQGNAALPEFTLDELRTNRISELEKEKNIAIESIIPTKDQLRFLAEAIYIVDRGPAANPQETAAKNSSRDKWLKIKAIHEQADTLTAAILVSNDPDSVDITLTIP